MCSVDLSARHIGYGHITEKRLERSFYAQAFLQIKANVLLYLCCISLIKKKTIIMVVNRLLEKHFNKLLKHCFNAMKT